MIKIENTQDVYRYIKPIFEKAKSNGISFRGLIENNYPKISFKIDDYISKRFNHKYSNNPLLYTDLIARIGDYIEKNDNLTPEIVEMAFKDSEDYFSKKQTYVIPIYSNVPVNIETIRVNDDIVVRNVAFAQNEIMTLCFLFKVANLKGKRVHIKLIFDDIADIGHYNQEEILKFEMDEQGVYLVREKILSKPQIIQKSI